MTQSFILLFLKRSNVLYKQPYAWSISS